MRIVVAGQLPPPIGGQNLAIAQLIERLDRVRELCPDLALEPIAHWRFGFTPTTSRVRKFGPGKAIELFRVWWRLWRLRTAGPIDLLIFPSGGAHRMAMIRDLLLLPLAKRCASQVVVHFHAAGIASERVPAWLKWAHRDCEAIVMTEFGRRDPAALGIESVAILPNAVALPLQRLKSSGEPTLLSVGHLCPEKGTPDLLRAFATLTRSYPDLRLRLVGECLPNWPDTELQSLIDGLKLRDRVYLSGVLTGDALAQAYTDASALVFASVAPYESFGLVLVEAMAYSLPILTTDWRANAEVAGPDAVLVEPNFEGLSAGLRTLIEQRNRWDVWGERNHERYLRHYTEERVTERWIEFLKSIARVSRQAPISSTTVCPASNSRS